MHQLTLALNAKCIARSKPTFKVVSVIAEEIEDYHADEWMVPGTGLEPVWLAPRDFKSGLSINQQQYTTLQRSRSKDFHGFGYSALLSIVAGF